MTTLELGTFTIELPITFRFATQTDLPKLEWHGQYSHFRNLFRRSFREQQRGRRLMLLADCGGFPIGHVFIQFSSTEHAIADGDQRAYLYSLRVMEMFRGHGIGTRLLEEAEALVMARGFCWTTIAVAKNNGAAYRLYRRLGYRIFREDPGSWSYIDHRGVRQSVHEPCWVLEKHLIMR